MNGSSTPVSALTASHPLRIVVLTDGFVEWAGGVDFIRLILSGLTSRSDIEAPTPLLVPVEDRTRRLVRSTTAIRLRLAEAIRGRDRGWRPKQLPAPEKVREWFADQAGRVEIEPYIAGISGLRKALRSDDADVVLPAFRPLGADFPVPWVGYIYDFQHRYLPELFNPSERASRDASFARMLREAPVVVVNAVAVRNDVKRFYPEHVHKVVPLPFAPVARAEWFQVDPGAVQRRYGLPDKFFVVSNQFWVHKDHATAIRALGILRSEGAAKDVAMVCTGKGEDYRAPGYFDSLRRIVSELGLSPAVHMLGLVPKADQMAITRSAVAVVQPTLFEGGPGGGAAYDAAAVGTPLIASDIPVNREVDIGDVRFFRASDEMDLAARMADTLTCIRTRPSIPELIERSQARVRELGQTIMHAALRAVEVSRNGSANAT